MLTTCLQRPISQICAKKIQNWVYLCFGKVLKLKVTKGELIIFNGLEMADDYLLGGGSRSPPPGPGKASQTPVLLGLTSIYKYSQMKPLIDLFMKQN